MPANDQTSPADKANTSNTAENNSNPTGLVKGVLDAALRGKESVVIGPKTDNTAQDKNEKIHVDEK